MNKPFTAVHNAARKLNGLIGNRNWSKAYDAADSLDIVMLQEDGVSTPQIYTFCTVTDLSEERFKRSKFN
jgi:hypothetical protein